MYDPLERYILVSYLFSTLTDFWHSQNSIVNIMIASASFFTLIIAIVAIHSPRISSAEILEARFTTRLDHGRAQDLRTASFVSQSDGEFAQF